MHITLSQEDLYKLAFQEVQRRGFQTAGIQAFNNSRQIADDVISFRIDIVPDPADAIMTPTPSPSGGS